MEKILKPMRWKRTIKRLLLDSEYNTIDRGDKFRILRHRKTSRVKLFIWRDKHPTVTEQYDQLPSVRFAKAFCETRRRIQGEQVIIPGADNPMVWS